LQPKGSKKCKAPSASSNDKEEIVKVTLQKKKKADSPEYEMEDDSSMHEKSGRKRGPKRKVCKHTCNLTKKSCMKAITLVRTGAWAVHMQNTKIHSKCHAKCPGWKHVKEALDIAKKMVRVIVVLPDYTHTVWPGVLD
jgi:hypothetical protein